MLAMVKMENKVIMHYYLYNWSVFYTLWFVVYTIMHTITSPEQSFNKAVGCYIYIYNFFWKFIYDGLAYFRLQNTNKGDPLPQKDA